MPTQQELNDKYKDNLAIGSLSLIPRDQFGNISINATDTTRDVLIERINWVFDNPSINKVIETRFSYYKFPPKIKITEVEDVPIDTLVNIDTLLGNSNTVNIMLKPVNQFNIPYMQSAVSQLNNQFSVTYQKDINRAEAELKLGDKSSGRYNLITTTVNGISSPALSVRSLYEGSFREIPFTTQLDGNPMITPGRFVVTKDIIDSNKNIKFNVNISLNHLCNETRILGRLIRYRNNNSNFYDVISGYSHLDLTRNSKYTQNVKWVVEKEKNMFLNLGLESLLIIKDKAYTDAASKEYKTIVDSFNTAKTNKNIADQEKARLQKIVDDNAQTEKDNTKAFDRLNEWVKKFAEYNLFIKKESRASTNTSLFDYYAGTNSFPASFTGNNFLAILETGLKHGAGIDNKKVTYSLSETGYDVYYFRLTTNAQNAYIGPTLKLTNFKGGLGGYIPLYITQLNEKYKELRTLIDLVNNESLYKNNQANYDKAVADFNEYVKTTYTLAQTTYNTTLKQYETEKARVQTIDEYEQILNGSIAHLNPGSSILNFSHVIDKKDLKLYDIYAVEILSAFNDSSIDENTIKYRPELIEDSTYWSITSTTEKGTEVGVFSVATGDGTDEVGSGGSGVDSGTGLPKPKTQA